MALFGLSVSRLRSVLTAMFPLDGPCLPYRNFLGVLAYSVVIMSFSLWSKIFCR